MKKIFLVAAFVLGISAVSFAQGMPSPQEQLDRFKTQVTGITDAQSAKLLVIYQAQAKSMDSLFQSGGEPQTMFPTMQKMMATNDAKIKTVLTPEQATAYQKQVDARNERFKQMQAGGGN
jgi:periplasmic protein CpxP/Spy